MGRVVVLASFTLLSGCASVEIAHEWDEAFGFEELKTFAWMTQSSGRRGREGIDSAELHQRFRDAVIEVLEEQGYEYQQFGEPDFRVGYHFAIGEEINQATISEYYGPAWGFQSLYGRRQPRVGPTQVVERRYHIGTVVIDMFDVESKELVWRGSGEGNLGQQEKELDPERAEENAVSSVRKILEGFPPGEGSD